MRELIVKMSISVDGFVCGPNGEIDWLFRTQDPEAKAWTVESISHAGLHIMGSRTFQDMAAYWPFSTEVFAAPMNGIPKAVFTSKGVVPPPTGGTTTAFNDASADRVARGEEPLSASVDVGNWRSPRVASGELGGEIARLKQEPGKEIMAHGGARFAQSLVKLGLVDEYRLLVHPVALGHGMALFSSLARPIDLQIVGTRAFGSGVVAKIYRPK
jgi:dihydrofolate reductase